MEYHKDEGHSSADTTSILLRFRERVRQQIVHWKKSAVARLFLELVAEIWPAEYMVSALLGPQPTYQCLM